MLLLLSLQSCYALLALMASSTQSELEYHVAETYGSLYDGNEHNDNELIILI